ncbi:hypothetical protein AN414_09770 [Serratia marcescens]|nr:hypothetical protein AN414_09770 [Serratia marcescens]
MKDAAREPMTGEVFDSCKDSGAPTAKPDGAIKVKRPEEMEYEGGDFLLNKKTPTINQRNNAAERAPPIINGSLLTQVNSAM